MAGVPSITTAPLVSNGTCTYFRKDYLYSQYRLTSQRQGVGGNLGIIWQQSPKLALGLNLTAPAYLAATDVDWAGSREYFRSQ